MIKLGKKCFCIFGYRGSGKSVLAHYIASQLGSSALIYDTLNECPATARYHSYTPKNRYSDNELEMMTRLVLHYHKYKLFIIDEANRFCLPKPSPLPQAIADLNDWCRHKPYELSVGYIARRPVQLNQDLTELADYLFIFKLGGKSDIAYLNDLVTGLGDAVFDLKPYHFIVLSPDRTFKAYSPVPSR